MGRKVRSLGPSKIVDVIGAAVPEGVVHVGNSVGCPLAHHGCVAETERWSDVKIEFVIVAKTEEVYVTRIDAELAICSA